MNVLSKILVCAAFSLAAGLVYSQPAPELGPPVRAEKPLKALGLTEDQVAQVIAVTDKARSAAQVQRAAVSVAEAQIRQAMVAPNPDLKAVNALVDQKTALLATLEKLKLAEEVQVRQIVGDKAFDQARKFLGKPAKVAQSAKAAKIKKRPRP